MKFCVNSAPAQSKGARAIAVCGALVCGNGAFAAGVSGPPLTEEVFWDEVPTVMSATRMSQPVVDSPVAVSVITQEMIEASGAREIPELFRMVPGFIVGYHDGHTPSVSYKMSLDRYARRMQVLIDGRSVYTTAIGGVPWATLHITLDDIERIEVVRGPNSASYGANSFLGVINIITRNAIADQGASVKVNIGDEGVRETYVRHGGAQGRMDYRVAVAYLSDDGLPIRKDYKRTQKFSFRVDYQLSAKDMISAKGGVGMGVRGVENRWTATLSPPREKEVLNHQQHIRWQRTLGVGESFSLHFYHIYQRNFEGFTIADLLLSSEGPNDTVLNPVSVDISRRTERYDLEFQHNLSMGESWRVAWGGGVRQDSVWGGEDLLGGASIGNHLNQGFINAEWDPDGRYLVNLGVMVENYSTTGTDYSPRLGFNYKFSSSHGVRLTASKAIRTPSMFEYAADYSFSGSTRVVNRESGVVLGPGADAYDLFVRGSQQLGVERITAYELGYNGKVLSGALSYDIKLYRDELSNLIALVTKPEPPPDINGKAATYENQDALVIRGLELESTYLYDNGASARLTYAYSRLEELSINNAVDYAKVAPKNSISLLVVKPFAGNYLGSLGYYYTHRINGWGAWGESRDPVRRLDLRLAKEMRLLGNNAQLALALRNVLGKYEEMELLRPRQNFTYFNEVDPSFYISMRVNMD